jgi:cytochrome b561
VSPRWVFYSKTDWPTDRLTVGRNVTLNLTGELVKLYTGGCEYSTWIIYIHTRAGCTVGVQVSLRTGILFRYSPQTNPSILQEPGSLTRRWCRRGVIIIHFQLYSIHYVCVIKVNTCQVSSNRRLAYWLLAEEHPLRDSHGVSISCGRKWGQDFQ